MRNDTPIPLGLCQCGCGQKTRIAAKSHARLGYVRGEPIKFVRGHSSIHQWREPIHNGEIVLVPLTQGKFAAIDVSDADRVLCFRWKATDCKGHWYAERRVRVPGKPGRSAHCLLHRFILGAPDDLQVDHKNGDGLDCRRSNIRIATPSQNSSNIGLTRANTSGYKGVCWLTGRQTWQAAIKHQGKAHFLGHFQTAEEAARAYDRKARELHGEFARLNFPDDPDEAAA